MAQGPQFRKRQGVDKTPDVKPEIDPRQLAEDEDLEQLQEQTEISQEQAQRLQPQMGNQAVQSLMNRTSGTGLGASMSVEIEEEQEEQVEQEEADHDHDLPEHGGSGGSGGGGGDPWDLGTMFGGVDDEDDSPLARTQRRMRTMRRLPSVPAQHGEDEEQDEDELHADLDAIAAAVGDAEQSHAREGDEIYAAVEAALMDPRRLARRQLRPEALVDQTGPMDPLGRPAEIGRFLVHAEAQVSTPMARALGRLLAGPAAALVPEAGGFSGAAARLSALAVCAEAAEAGGATTDRAVALGLSWEAWPAAVSAARELAPRLHAPQITSSALAETGTGATEPEAGRPGRLPAPHPLGGAALGRVIPAGFVPEVPSIERRERPPPPAESEAVAAVDALLAQLTGGPDPTEPPDAPELTWQSLEPFLDATSALVNAMGRCQVELAAAAVAVRWVRADAPVDHVLSHGDRALRRLAHEVVQTGEALERLEGEPLHLLGDEPREAVATVRRARVALESLRHWAFDTLAGAISEETRAPEAVQVRP